MKDFNGKVAVVTGSASGIGYALAERAARQGMSVVIADIREEALSEAAEKLSALGAEVLPIVTDVSNQQSIEALAQQTLDRFAAVHLLFNNAGIVAGSDAENTSYDDWEWMLGVNLWSIIYGTRVFLPILKSQNQPCHIVNTSSTAGLLYVIGSMPYSTIKHAVVGYSEALSLDLATKASQIGVSVLCPGLTATNIMASEKVRPQHLQERSQVADMPGAKEHFQAIREALKQAKSAEEVADFTFDAIRENRFYIIPATDSDKQAIQHRAESIVQRNNPEVSWQV